MNPTNLLEIIYQNRHNPTEICVFFENFQKKIALTNQLTIDYSEIFAHYLFEQTSHIKEKNVLISLDNQMEFLICIFACLLAGKTPIPVANKTLLPKDEYLELILNITKDSGATTIITTKNTKPILNNILSLKILTIDEFPKLGSQRIPFHSNFNPSDIFFIQYSSGSTRNPKGIVLTHKNIMTNLEQIKQKLELDPKIDSSLSWLPLHHDMGLIGMAFSAYYNVGTTNIMGPIDFIKSPYGWLKLASDLKVSIINAPNSGYHTAISKITDDECKNLNLSSIKVAMCGAEPINPQIIKNFNQKFNKTAMKPNIFFPVYGLAEATLAVTFPKLNTPVKTISIDYQKLIESKVDIIPPSVNSLELVSCGGVLSGTELQIKSLSNNQNLANQIGEIWIRGESISPGYWRNNQSLEIIKDQEGWINTGDLGFLHEGELYITGRSKDLIIANGKNYIAHDLELKISSLPTLKMGRIVIFSVIKPGLQKEEVIIIAETSFIKKGKRQDLKNLISKKISSVIPVPVQNIYLIPPFNTKKTTSGKVKRYLMKELFLRGEIANIEKRFLKNYLKGKIFVYKVVIENLLK